MGGLFVVFVAWVCRNDISDWLSDAIAEGIKRSKVS